MINKNKLILREPSFLIFILSTMVALTFILLPLRTMLQHFLYEDMFYYLRVAEHIVAGNGSTFDGISPTNGYHPAWMLISTALAHFLNDEGLVRALLFAAAILHGGQTVLIYRIVSRNANKTIAIGLSIFFALNWRALATNLSGLETPLAVFILLISVDYIDRLKGRELSNNSRIIILGLLLSAGVYARFDFLLFCVLAIAYVAYLTCPLGRRKILDVVMLLCLTIFLSLIPWFLFSLHTSGVLLPNSREAVKLLGGGGLNLSSWEVLNEAMQRILFSGIYWASDSANLVGVWPSALPTGRMSQLAAVILALFVIWVIMSAYRLRHKIPKVAWLCILYFILHNAYYLFEYRLEVRYVLPAYALLLIVVGFILGNKRTESPTKASVAFLFILFAVSTISGIHAWSQFHGATRTHAWHSQLYDAAEWVRQKHPNAKIGSWNAGIISYFSRAEVINLDGVINDHALLANRSKEIDKYILNREITYLIDIESQMEGYLSRFARKPELLYEVVANFGDVVVVITSNR